MAKLSYKIHIKGNIEVQTGLHIGGSEVELDIGGIDKEVIKIKQGDKRIPYIPGSSLKGKIRSLLARKKGSMDVRDDGKQIIDLFGLPNAGKNSKKTLSRLIVRDCYPVNNEFTLEEKTENTIIRKTGDAKPRQLERVTKGTSFGLDMIVDVYDIDNYKELLETLDKGFQLLHFDYLGGSGTRGYGQVNLSDITIKKIDFKKEGKVDDTQTLEYDFNVNKL